MGRQEENTGHTDHHINTFVQMVWLTGHVTHALATGNAVICDSTRYTETHPTTRTPWSSLVPHAAENTPLLYCWNAGWSACGITQAAHGTTARYRGEIGSIGFASHCRLG